MLKTQRNYGDKCGLSFKKKMTKDERKRERKMKKLQQKKALSLHVLPMS